MFSFVIISLDIFHPYVLSLYAFGSIYDIARHKLKSNSPKEINLGWAEEVARSLLEHGFRWEVVILFISMIPIFELRLAIPVAEALSEILIWKICLIAVIGNMVPVLPILLFLEPVSNFLRVHFKLADRFFEWLFARTRRRIESKIKKYGALGLALFVAIPLPVTGAWTGCMAAFLFGIKTRRAFPSILAGVMIAGVIVSIITYGASAVIKLF